jgi:hypothetical protein
MPSRQEFLQTVESEFAFLEEEGYSREITDEFRVDYAKGPYRLAVAGASYGQAVDIGFFLDGKDLSIWGLLPPERAVRQTPRTDAPQLDMIRECAWWYRSALRGLFQGKPEFKAKLEALLAERRRQEESWARRQAEGKQALFFKVADELFKAKQYAECVRHLEAGAYPLPESWKARLDYAKKH